MSSWRGVLLTFAHTQVSKEKKGKVVDARCRDLTNSAVCTKGLENPGSVDLCDWHEVCASEFSNMINLQLLLCRTLANWSQATSFLQVSGHWRMSCSTVGTIAFARTFSSVAW